MKRSSIIGLGIGSGLHAPARFLLALLGAAASLPASAQVRPGAPAAPVAAPVAIQAPDIQTVNKLVWSTVAAIDHGNVTGNYSVLRDLGAPGFQTNNNATTLAGVFQNVRTQRIDLSDTLLLAPTYEFAPGIVQNGLLRARGSFGLRPTAIAFDFLYAYNGARWQLFGTALVPIPLPTNQPPLVRSAPVRR